MADEINRIRIVYEHDVDTATIDQLAAAEVNLAQKTNAAIGEMRKVKDALDPWERAAKLFSGMSGANITSLSRSPVAQQLVGITKEADAARANVEKLVAEMNLLGGERAQVMALFERRLADQVRNQFQGKVDSILDKALGKPGEAESRFAGVKEGWAQIAMGLDHAINLAERFYGKVREIVGGVIELGSRTEMNRITAAGMIQAAGFTPQGPGGFQRSLAASADLDALIRQQAPAFRGTEADLRAITQALIAPGAQAGLSLRGVESLAFKAGSVGGAFGIDAGTLSHELQMMLQGHARGMMPLFRQLAPFMPGGEAGFNQLSATGRLDAINAALGKFNEMIKASADSWQAVSTTTESYATEVRRLVGAPVFEALKGILKEINGWYEAHREQVKQLAEDFGHKLADGIKAAWEWAKKIGPVLVDVVGFVVDHRDAILRLIAAYEALKISFAIAENWQTIAKAAAAATQLWEAAQWALDVAMLANPIGLIVAAAIALLVIIGYVALYWDKVAISAERAYVQMLRTMSVFGDKDMRRNTSNIADRMEADMRLRQVELATKQASGRDNFINRVQDLFGVGGEARGEKGIGAIDKDLLAEMGVVTGAGKAGRGMFGGIADKFGDAIADMRGQVKAPPNVNVGGIHQTITINRDDDPNKLLILTQRAVQYAVYHPTESVDSPGTIVRTR